ncbi:MAG TPA: hypothetical protein VJT49_29825 [Amycolatopsis sp.]|uniref:GH12 family glycosyl hydrolase domain-containing protein n=1 Tax=Amycolatopsis sp. TaxID=37632 RepID=UPI002B46E21A|nr:hypothetical protein [Amycolatopsis sp.]HKS49234.1 hypothetical protein [Amycolatopsis sp.]
MDHPLAHAAFRVSIFIAAIGLGGAALTAVVGVVLLAVPSATSAATAGAKACGKGDVVPSGDGEYLAQNNVWGADTAQCIIVGDRSLTVDVAEHDRPPNGDPAAYPALIKGCHWGKCSTGSGLPVQVARMPGVMSDWASRQVDSGIYNAAYVVWFHRSPVAAGTPDGAELIIWLSSHGGIRPGGVRTATAVPLAGATWNVWFEQAQGRNRIVYQRIGDVSSVQGLDIRAFAMDSVGRGWIRPEWYLIGVEGGFNLWSGGAGNAIERFSVSVDAARLPPAGTR